MERARREPERTRRKPKDREQERRSRAAPNSRILQAPVATLSGAHRSKKRADQKTEKAAAQPAPGADEREQDWHTELRQSKANAPIEAETRYHSSGGKSSNSDVNLRRKVGRSRATPTSINTYRVSPLFTI